MQTSPPLRQLHHCIKNGCNYLPCVPEGPPSTTPACPALDATAELFETNADLFSTYFRRCKNSRAWRKLLSDHEISPPMRVPLPDLENPAQLNAEARARLEKIITERNHAIPWSHYSGSLVGRGGNQCILVGPLVMAGTFSEASSSAQVAYSVLPYLGGAWGPPPKPGHSLLPPTHPTSGPTPRPPVSGGISGLTIPVFLFFGHAKSGRDL